MNNATSNVPFGIWTGGNVQGVTIANLTIRDIYEHPINFNAGTQSPLVYNVRLIDAGQQLLKSNPDASGVGAANGDVEYSIFEYTTTAPTYYTNAIDIHGGANWIIRHNLFRNIVASAGQLAGPAVLAWNHSSGTLTEGNTFVNCARAIAYGLQDISGFDHQGGVIRNNMIYRSAAQPGDVAIQVVDSPNTQVLSNTVLQSGTYPSAIEYRFAGTTGVVITGNLLDAAIQARDGGVASVKSNLTTAAASWFVNAAAGDLHLKATATGAIDRGVASVTTDWDGDARPSGAAPDLGADEYVSAATYTLSGHVVTSSGSALPGATVTLDGAATGSKTTDATGAYSFAGLAGGSTYTLTPSKSGYTMTPANRSYSALSASQSSADFTATPVPPPSVSLTAPANGTKYTTPAAIAVSAAASSSGSTIAKVDFYAGATLVGSDTTSPYSVVWSVSTLGSYTLTAVATDSLGNSTTSAGVTISVANPVDVTLPAVSMTAPAVGATVSGTGVTVSAAASDNVGIAGVQFKLDGANLGPEDTAAPYSFVWNSTTVADGTHTLTAVARDAAGNTATAAALTVKVSNAVSACPCSLWTSSTLPAQMDNEKASVELGMKFTADTAGFVSGVRFYKYAQNTGTHVGHLWSSSGTLLGTVTFSGETASGWQQAMFASPIAVNANTTYVISYHTNTGYYAANVSGFSSAVNKAPLHAPASTTSSGNGVYLYGSGTGFPNQTWNASNYWVDLVFTTVAGSTPPPAPVVTVSMTAPIAGSSFTAPASIALAATASTTSGSISKVDYYNGSTLVATSTTAPFAATWSNVAAGTYTLSAKVTTSGGQTATSSPISVTVTAAAPQPPPPPPPSPTVTTSLASPASGSTYVEPITIALAADATATSDTIAKVEFFNGTTLIGSDTTAPYGFTWSNVMAGTYAIAAKATTVSGATAMSAPATVTVAGTAPSGSKLVQLTDFATWYVGSFKLPPNVFAYARRGLCLDGSRHALVAGTLDTSGNVAEVTIPTVGGTASLLVGAMDPTEGKMGSVGGDSPWRFGGCWVRADGSMIVSAFSFYDGSATQSGSFFTRPADLSVKGQVKGAFPAAGAPQQKMASGAFASIPAAWQAALGGDLLAGQCCTNIVSASSHGPAFGSMRASDVGVTNAWHPLTYYTQAHPLHNAWNVTSDIYNGTTEETGLCFPDGTDTVIVVGRQGTGTYSYGEATSADPADQNKGNHAYPYRHQVWLYDAHDLAAVHAGTKQPYDVTPYAYGQLLGMPSGTNMQQTLGCAYDPATKTMYIGEDFAAGFQNTEPVIHVYQVR